MESKPLKILEYRVRSLWSQSKEVYFKYKDINHKEQLDNLLR